MIIFFDFDGTIVDSTKAKLDSFKALFDSFPDKERRQIYSYLASGQGVPRMVKFKHIYQEILHLELIEAEAQRLSDKLDLLIEKAMGQPKLLGDIDKFLSDYETAATFVIVSAAPKREISSVLHKLKLTNYFNKIYGSEIPKAQAIQEVLAERNVKTGAYMIGDTMNDFIAASDANISFVGFGADRDLLGYAPNMISHYSELPPLIGL